MSAIIFNKVDFSYQSPYQEVFTQLSLVLDTHWRTGVIGRNGQGKSTLLGLIHQHFTPDSGEVFCHRPTLYFPMIPVPSELTTLDVIKDTIAPFRQWEQQMDQLLSSSQPNDITTYCQLQEQYQHAGGYSINANIEQEFINLDLPLGLLKRKFTRLSGGEQSRALISSLFINQECFPLIDEPTNHLDLKGRQQLGEYLSTKPGFLLISHDRHFLDSAINHVLSLNKANISMSRGNYTRWKTHTDAIEAHEKRVQTKIEQEVKQLTLAAQKRRQGALNREKDKYATSPNKRTPGFLDKGFIGHRAAKQMKQALTVEKRISKKLKIKKTLLLNKEKNYTIKIKTQVKTGLPLITIQNLSISYGQNKILQNFSLTLFSGDRIAIVGSNGSGKSSIFKSIAGDLLLSDGLINKPAYIKFSRAYQQPLWQNGLLRQHLYASGLNETRFRQFLGTFGVSGNIFERPLETFSQGQLKKIDLCRSMMSSADFLMWDEPMNYIDLFSREQIEKAIIAYQPTMLFIEHDREFVERVATQIIELD